MFKFFLSWNGRKWKNPYIHTTNFTKIKMDRYDFRVDIDFIEWKLNSQKIFSALLRRPSNVSSSIPRLKDFWFLTKLQGFCLKNNFHFTKKIFALNHYLASIYLQLQPVHEKYFKQGNFMPGHAHPNNWWVGWISAKFGTSTVYKKCDVIHFRALSSNTIHTKQK